MRIKFINLKIKLLFAATFLLFNYTFAQVSQLKVIPEVQRFEYTHGFYAMPDNLILKVDISENDSLKNMAIQLKREIQETLPIKIKIEETIEKTSESNNEIYLSYTNKKLKNNEAYTLNINNQTGITIQGNNKKGIFWGTRTLLQLIVNHNNKIPTGLIIDYPDFASRGFMLDTGRKFFTISYLRDYVKILSYYKMNEFHVHLNDNGFKTYFNDDWSKTYAAFRLESETYPGLTSTDGFYTKKEFRDLQLLGMQYGVNVIPEIDIPAHSLAFTRYNPTLKASSPYADDHLDILNDEKLPFIYNFFDNLFDEYIKGENPTFVGPDVHIGTDEYIKEGRGRDVDNAQAQRFREFTNHYLKYIADLGKTPRLWGGLEWLKDEPLTKVKPVGGAIMNAWSKDWVNAEKMLADGFKIISTPDEWLYIVPRAGYYKDYLDIEWIYKNYRPEMVNSSVTLSKFHPGLLGSTFAVWNDIVGNGTSQLDIHDRSIPAVKVVGTKNWKVNPTKQYEEYLELSRNVIDAVGINLSGKYSDIELKKISENLDENNSSLNGANEIKLGGKNIGLHYDISFDIKPSKNKRNAIIFKSEHGKVLYNLNGKNNIGFTRDGYVNSFDVKLEENTWQKIRFLSNDNGLKLFINGKIKSILEPFKKTKGIPNNLMYYQTLHFPLEKIGDSKNGFKGEIKNLIIKTNS